MADAIFFKEVYTAPAGLVDMRSVDSAEVDAFLHCGTSTALTREQVAYVRRCFDWLLYYFDRVAYLHENGMLESTDFDATVKPYASFIAERWAYHRAYCLASLVCECASTDCAILGGRLVSGPILSPVYRKRGAATWRVAMSKDRRVLCLPHFSATKIRTTSPRGRAASRPGGALNTRRTRTNPSIDELPTHMHYAG